MKNHKLEIVFCICIIYLFFELLAGFIFISPNLHSQYRSMNVELPFATKSILSLSDLVSSWWFFGVSIFFIPFFCVHLYLKRNAITRSMDRNQFFGEDFSLIVLVLTLVFLKVAQMTGLFYLFIPMAKLVNCIGFSDGIYNAALGYTAAIVGSYLLIMAILYILFKNRASNLFTMIKKHKIEALLLTYNIYFSVGLMWIVIYELAYFHSVFESMNTELSVVAQAVLSISAFLYTLLGSLRFIPLLLIPVIITGFLPFGLYLLKYKEKKAKGHSCSLYPFLILLFTTLGLVVLEDLVETTMLVSYLKLMMPVGL